MRRVDADSVEQQPIWMPQPKAITAPAAVADAPRENEHDKYLREEIAAARRKAHEAGMADAEQIIEQRIERELARRRTELEHDVAQLREELQATQSRLEQWLGALPEALRVAEQQAEESAIVATYAAIAHFFAERHAQGGLLREICLEALLQVQGEARAVYVSAGEHALFESIPELPVVTDARLQPGQCRIETRLGHYDAGLDARMDLIRDALLTGLSRHRAGHDDA